MPLTAGTTSGWSRVQPSPNEIEMMLTEERDKRRKRRIQQVRRESKKDAQRIREKIRKQKQVKADNLQIEAIEKYRQKKTVELALLEEEYQRCLRDLGIGHQGAKEQEEYDLWVKEQRELQRKEALNRGERAWRATREQKSNQEKLKENKIALKTGVLLTEKLRAATVRTQILNEPRSGKMELIETDAAARRKVTLVNKSQWVKNDLSFGKTQEDYVKRLPLAEISCNGLEAAIREQEQEARERHARDKQLQAARLREEEALIKGKKRQRKKVQFSDSHDYDTPDSESTPRLSTIQEVSENTTSNSILDLELDHIPVRGPSSSSSSTLSSSNDNSSSPQSSRQTHIKPLRPSVPGNLPAMGGPSSAFSSVVKSNLDKDDVDNIRALLDRVEKQKRDLAAQAKRDGGEGGTVEGEGFGAKNTDSDRDFVARVLGLSAQDMATAIETRKDESATNVEVEINVQELSSMTTQTETTATTVRRRRNIYVGAESSSSSSTTATTAESSAINSSSSDIIQQERFLQPPILRSQVVGQEYRQRRDVTDYSSIHTLIAELSTTVSETHSSSRGGGRAGQQAKLRKYIEKLLGMRRTEINDLSVTMTSEESVSTVSASSSSCNSYRGSAGSRSDVGSSSNAGSSSNQSPGFITSTPASILVSSSSDSKSSSGGSKTVRFKDQVDVGESIMEHEKLDDNLEKKVSEIEKKTQVSLDEIRRAYEAKKAEIERELAERRERKRLRGDQSSSLSSSSSVSRSSNASLSVAISEGPLSESTVDSTPRQKSIVEKKKPGKSAKKRDAESPSTSSSSISSSSASSSLSSHVEGLSGVLEALKLNWAQSMLKREEERRRRPAAAETTTSSSGGSVAVAELKAKLAGMEMPQLKKPPSRLTTTTTATTTTDDSTFAKIGEIQSEEVAEEFSSFHFSQDDEQCGGGIEDEPEVSFISLSSDE